MRWDGGGGNPPVWSADGRSITAVYSKEGKANLGAFDVTSGKETDVTSGNQAVVSFRQGTPLSQRLAVRSTCAKVPAVKAQPLPSDLNSPYALQQVTFRIDHATDADVARLETCLTKFPAVVGITLQDSSDMGG